MWIKINELIRDKKKNISCIHSISAYSFNEYFSKVGYTVTSKFVNQDDIKWKNPTSVYAHCDRLMYGHSSTLFFHHIKNYSVLWRNCWVNCRRHLIQMLPLTILGPLAHLVFSESVDQSDLAAHTTTTSVHISSGIWG